MAYSIEDVINDAQADGALSADEAATLRLGVERLRQIEAAARLVWGTHFSFPGLACVPGTPLDQLREALGAAGR